MAANITINNGATTPVAKTFTFAMQNGLLFAWNEMSGGIYEGFNRLTISVRPAGASNMGHRVNWKLDVPRLATTAPASGSGVQPNPTAAYVSVSKGEFMIPKAADLDNRKDTLAFTKNLLASATLQSLIHDLSTPA